MTISTIEVSLCGLCVWKNHQIWQGGQYRFQTKRGPTGKIFQLTYMGVIQGPGYIYYRRPEWSLHITPYIAVYMAIDGCFPMVEYGIKTP